MCKETKTPKKPSLAYAIITLVALIAFVVICYSLLKIPIMIALLFSWLVLGAFALGLGYTMKEIEKAITEMIKIGVGLFALLLAVGCMISMLLAGGAVPTLVLWGLKVITPKIFLGVAFTLCAVVGLATGTSWGTTSTIGVAMMGVGLGLQIPAPMIAGAVLSGSCLGTICSPVSDGPLLSATVCNIDILRHCKHLISVALPAFIVSLIGFLILGATKATGTYDPTAINEIIAAIEGNFKTGLIPLIPLIVIVVLLVMRKPATTAILIGALIGAVITVCYQGYSIADVGAYLASGFKVSTGNSILDPILNRGGVSSMLNLIATVVASLGIGGIMKDCDTMDVIVEALHKKVRTRAGITTVALLGNTICDLMVSTNYFATVINNTMLCPLYKQLGYAPENCSRINSFLAVIILDFFPWTLGAVFATSTLGVPTQEYFPYMFFFFAAAFIVLLYGYTGWFMKKLDPNEDNG